MAEFHQFKRSERTFALTIAMWQYIGDFIEQYGFPPTMADIREHFGFASNSGVIKYLDRLSMWGFVHRWEKLARGILVLQLPRDVLMLKLSGAEDEEIPEDDG